MTAVPKWDPKDPNDIIDLWIDWTNVLPAGVTIASQTITLPTGITVVSSSFTNTWTRVRLSGGTNGNSYAINCAVTGSDGEIFNMLPTLQVSTRTV